MTDPLRPLGDDRLVAKAARRIAVQTTGLVTLAMLVLAGFVSLDVARGQSHAEDRLLRSTLATVDDVGDPPAGTWVVLDRAGKAVGSPGLPVRLAPALARLRSQAAGSPTVRELAPDDRTQYRVATQRRSDATVQVVLDLTQDHLGRARLWTALAAASVLAVLAALALGALLGRRAVRPLAQALALQRTFVADASHELRTPLTLLSTRAQLLDRAIEASGLDGQLRADSRGVVRDVQRMGEVVEDLLLAADPGQDEPRTTSDLGELAVAAVDSALAHARRVEVDLGVARADAGPHQVLCSVPAVRRAVLALIDNAVDHTPPGGEVRVRIGRRAAEVVLSVTDTGPGLRPEAAQDVFRRFHSGGQRAGRRHYGLGLALTRDVADRHGGHLRLVPGGPGATFELALPAADG